MAVVGYLGPVDLADLSRRANPAEIAEVFAIPIEVRDWYLIAEKTAPAPHLAHPERCAALRIVLVTVPRVSATPTPAP